MQRGLSKVMKADLSVTTHWNYVKQRLTLAVEHLFHLLYASLWCSHLKKKKCVMTLSWARTTETWEMGPWGQGRRAKRPSAPKGRGEKKGKESLPPLPPLTKLTMGFFLNPHSLWSLFALSTGLSEAYTFLAACGSLQIPGLPLAFYKMEQIIPKCNKAWADESVRLGWGLTTIYKGILQLWPRPATLMGYSLTHGKQAFYTPRLLCFSMPPLD